MSTIRTDGIDYDIIGGDIIGGDMQLVEVELDPRGGVHNGMAGPVARSVRETQLPKGRPGLSRCSSQI